jgi:DNA-binding PadR family transcriptional regulator
MSLKHAILASLSKKPQTGYDLSRQISGSIGFYWPASHQQIYKELAALEKCGWLGFKEVRQDEKPDKKIYRVTREGLAELKSWIEEETELAASKDALLIKLFAAQLVKPEIILAVFEEQRKKREARLKKYLEIESHYTGKKLGVDAKLEHLSVRRGILYERAWAKWAEETVEFLRTL